MPIETEIETMMDAMHQAIVTADFVQLQALAPELELALTALGPKTHRRSMARLQAKARRNAQAALAAGKGVRAAIQRLEEVRQNAVGLMVYDETGRRPVQNGGGELSRRL